MADFDVVRSEAIEKARENFEEACDEDTPLKFRPLRLMAEFMGKLRQSLSESTAWNASMSSPTMTVLLPGIPSCPSGAVRIPFGQAPPHD